MKCRTLIRTALIRDSERLVARSAIVKTRVKSENGLEPKSMFFFYQISAKFDKINIAKYFLSIHPVAAKVEKDVYKEIKFLCVGLDSKTNHSSRNFFRTEN